MTVLVGWGAAGTGALASGAGAADVGVCVVGAVAPAGACAVGDCMALVCAFVAATARCAAALGTVTIPWARSDMGAATEPATATPTSRARAASEICREAV